MTTYSMLLNRKVNSLTRAGLKLLITSGYPGKVKEPGLLPVFPMKIPVANNTWKNYFFLVAALCSLYR